MQNKNLTFKLQWYPKIYGWSCSFFFKLFTRHCFFYYQNYQQNTGTLGNSLLGWHFSLSCVQNSTSYALVQAFSGSNQFTAHWCVWQSSDQVSTSGCQRPAHRLTAVGCNGLQESWFKEAGTLLSMRKDIFQMEQCFQRRAKLKAIWSFGFSWTKCQDTWAIWLWSLVREAVPHGALQPMLWASTLWPLGKRQKLQ